MNTERVCAAPHSREIKKEGQWKQELVVLNNKRYYHVTHDNGIRNIDFWFRTKKEMDCFCIVFSEILPNRVWTLLQKEFLKYRFDVVTSEKNIYYDLYK